MSSVFPYRTLFLFILGCVSPMVDENILEIIASSNALKVTVSREMIACGWQILQASEFWKPITY